jgi:hypothetical protein
MIALAVAATFAATAAVAANVRHDPVPMVGTDCPSGFEQSQGWCVPHRDDARDAIVRIGPGCPVGWQHSGHAYCVRTRQ